ncbi:hypothetical protein Gotur_004248 [Gossypium turneri]
MDIRANAFRVDSVSRGLKMGCSWRKLPPLVEDPKLISVLVERWRPETHTFYLTVSVTITLKDMYLQLGLLMDELVAIRSIQSIDLGTICYNLLGLVLETIYGGRIEMPSYEIISWS